MLPYIHRKVKATLRVSVFIVLIQIALKKLGSLSMTAYIFTIIIGYSQKQNSICLKNGVSLFHKIFNRCDFCAFCTNRCGHVPQKQAFYIFCINTIFFCVKSVYFNRYFRQIYKTA